MRSTALVPIAATISGDVLKKNPTDEDSVLDMEDTETHYGQNQYPSNSP